jgi:predicted TIM-barrel fold metal-dependent hydrolase
VRFVIPHFGAGPFAETLSAGEQCPNVYVDSSSSNSWMAAHEPELTLRDVFERALEAFGSERILFGTDSNVFPAGWRRERFDDQQSALRALGLADAEIERWRAGNARRLLAP